tara:strand:- start:1829 stop:2545 length:717 start_codon:yes stop_codon:yes gene_type:complete
MVRVDTVYQRVLALANKEQRGYITPQEFNLFACQAQLEIVEQYFYDVNMFGRLHGNDTEYSDMLNLLDQKIAELTIQEVLPVSTTGVANLPRNIYRLGTVTFGGTEADMVNYNELIRLNKSTLTKPTIHEKEALSTPVYVKNKNTITVFPTPTSVFLQTLPVAITYVGKPYCPYWGYVVVSEKAMYNPADSVEFVLHPSDETELVNRILGLAGITIQKPELVQAATQMEGQKQGIEKQ